MIPLKAYVGQTRSGPGSATAKWFPELETLGVGEMTVRGELPNRRSPWAFDNGAYRDFTAGMPFDVRGFERDLDYLHLHSRTSPDFIVCPDIVAGGLASLDFSLSWVARLRHLAPAYLAVQDGMTEAEVAPVLAEFGGLFVGGTSEWKFGTGGQWAQLARDRGLPLHVGRVSSLRRIRWAYRIGATSIDSCQPWRRPATEMKRFLRGLRAPTLFRTEAA